MQNFDHNIGIWEKRHFFRQKLGKIAENCEHNIDPRQDEILLSGEKSLKLPCVNKALIFISFCQSI
jgi:hypothetical protein